LLAVQVKKKQCVNVNAYCIILYYYATFDIVLMWPVLAVSCKPECVCGRWIGAVPIATVLRTDPVIWCGRQSQ